MSNHHKINYIEFPASDIQATKKFFNRVFEWSFMDFGPDYTCFIGQGTDGGFYKSDLKSRKSAGAALIVLYSEHLEKTMEMIKEAGGKIIVDIFSFPGGRRFHFTDPNGNEMAVWSE
ncbi:MAG: VOC family protein [Emcibacter sp.]|nr:VOC family protein [Emcibacter sp.]